MLAWECVDMMYEWTGAAGVSPPHLGVNERVQLGYLPLTYVVYEMVQLGYLPPHPHMVQLGYLPLTTLQCIPDGGGRRIGIDVWSASVRVSLLCGIRMHVCISVSLYGVCICYAVSGMYETEHLTPWIHPSSTSATPHKSQSFSIFAPANHVLFKKQTTSPHIKVLYVFIYGTSFKKIIMYTWCIHAACFVHWYP